MIVFLIGMMGSGKSTLGRAIANSLGCNFLDMDCYIESKIGLSIAEIFEIHGEPFFREQEHLFLENLKNSAQGLLIVSTGGGVPQNPANMLIMKKKGKIIYLRTATELLVKRVHKNLKNRPILNDVFSEDELIISLEKLLNTREPMYLRADTIFDTSISKANNIKGLLTVINELKRDEMV
ncbi:MAG: shikimate kinase [Saprospiraceae bacterium]|jgi:shikimate kinase|nr:shikimate kinase [Saprospiraceae bacterium]